MRGVVALLVIGFLFIGISVFYAVVRSQETVGNTLYVGVTPASAVVPTSSQRWMA
jgi:hypothetical protein